MKKKLKERLQIVEQIFKIGLMNGWFYVRQQKSISNQNGAGTVEYTMSMAIAFIILLGVFELFRAMSINIYLEFTGWVCKPYP